MIDPTTPPLHHQCASNTYLPGQKPTDGSIVVRTHTSPLWLICFVCRYQFQPTSHHVHTYDISRQLNEPANQPTHCDQVYTTATCQSWSPVPRQSPPTPYPCRPRLILRITSTTWGALSLSLSSGRQNTFANAAVGLSPDIPATSCPQWTAHENVSIALGLARLLCAQC